LTTSIIERAVGAGDQLWSLYNQQGERLDEEDRQEGCSKQVQC
jgi:hypothetical protein